jgi:transposase-like protein
MARGKPHSEELRAEVAAALLAGMSISDAARRYSLDKSIVSRIRSNLDVSKLQQVATENEIRIDLAIAEGLHSHLKLQRAITEYAAREDYIREQDAGNLAKLLEVSTSYSIRLLEAASEIEGADSPEDEDTSAVS